MIVKESVKIEERYFIKTYSDQNLIICKVGTDEEYDEALDLATKPCEYEETDKKVEDLKLVDEDLII